MIVIRKRPEVSLTNDSFVMAIQATLTNAFEGTSAELLAQVDHPDRPPRDWPKNARAVTMRLRRQAPPMRKAGWTVSDDGGANKSNSARWTIIPPEINRDRGSPR